MKTTFTLALLLLFSSPFLAAQSVKENNPNLLVDTVKIANWITKHAIPIETLELNTINNDDFKQIVNAFKDKRVIGLGDGTHGTKEFFLLKHRLLKYMIDNENCKAIALEMPIDVGVHINNFVKTGEGNIDDILKNAWWWHQCEEIKSFLVWLKDYNATKPDNQKVSFYGFDCQVRGDNTYQLFQSLKKMDENYVENIEPFYNFLAAFYIDNYSSFTSWRKQQCENFVAQLKNLLETKKDDYIKNSSKEEYFITKARFNVFVTQIEFKKDNMEYSAIRSKANTETIKILLEMQDANDNLAIWAHNGHIASDTYIRQEYFNFPTTDGFYDINVIPEKELTGMQLRKEFGDDYFNIGFEFYKGGFSAIEYGEGLNDFTVADPESNTLPYLLNKPNIKSNSYFIALNPTAMDSATLNYFSAQQFCHEIGAAYVSRYVIKRPLSSYNAIVFFKETTASKLLENK
jgi:Erythromycin esterase homolog